MISDGPEILQLGEDDQLALTGLLLRVMNRDVEQEDDEEVRVGREGVRNALRYLAREGTPDGRPDHSPLDIEGEELGERLRNLSSEAHAMQLMIEATVWQPWETTALNERRRGHLKASVRRDTLNWAIEQLPGSLPPQKVFDREVLGSVAKKRLLMLGTGVGVAALGVATAGVAAPVIGSAIGGTLGLSGAAATSAGLAWLGGGSLAAGGFGMAGGTVILSAAGAVGGGGIGAFLADQTDRRSKAQIGLEAKKLRATIRMCAHEDCAPDTRRRGREQQLVLELELAELLALRVASSVETGEIVDNFDDAIRKVTAMRQFVSVDEFELEAK